MDLWRQTVPPMLSLTGETAFSCLVRASLYEQATGRRVIHTEIGDLRQRIPIELEGAMVEAIRRGETHYVGSQGMLPLREEICRYYALTHGLDVRPEQVVVTCGAKPGITTTIAAFVEFDDQVVIPESGYPVYGPQVSFYGGAPMSLPFASRDGNAVFDLERWQAVAPETKLLILNSPHNPTGTVLSREQLRSIASIAERKSVIILSDEAYGEIFYGERPSSIAQCEEVSGQTIVIGGISKMFAATGLRLGWCVVPDPRVAAAMTTFVANVYSCVPPAIQIGTTAALRSFNDHGSAWRWVEDLRVDLAVRRSLMARGLDGISGIKFSIPDGAFYFWIDVSGTGLTGEQFAERFLRERFVCVLPGDSFGASGSSFIRICFAGLTDEDIVTVCRNFREFATPLVTAAV